MTANSTPESHDAVVAEMRAEWLDAHTISAAHEKTLTKLSQWADRVQSAHARELAEQQATHAAEVGELRDRLISASCYERLCDAELSASRARAEAAEQDARRYRELRDTKTTFGVSAQYDDAGKAIFYLRLHGYGTSADDVDTAIDAFLAQQALAGGERKDG